MSYECFKLDLDTVTTYFVVEDRSVYKVTEDAGGIISTCSETRNETEAPDEAVSISESELPDSVREEFERGESPV